MTLKIDLLDSENRRVLGKSTTRYIKYIGEGMYKKKLDMLDKLAKMCLRF